jgi:hypothetical protein
LHHLFFLAAGDVLFVLVLEGGDARSHSQLVTQKLENDCSVQRRNATKGLIAMLG